MEKLELKLQGTVSKSGTSGFTKVIHQEQDTSTRIVTRITTHWEMEIKRERWNHCH